MKIIENVESHKISHQLINNTRIALNCSKIAIRYVLFYLIFSRNAIYVDFGHFDVFLSHYVDSIGQVYQMSAYDNMLARI